MYGQTAQGVWNNLQNETTLGGISRLIGLDFVQASLAIGTLLQSMFQLQLRSL